MDQRELAACMSEENQKSESCVFTILLRNYLLIIGYCLLAIINGGGQERGLRSGTLAPHVCKYLNMISF